MNFNWPIIGDKIFGILKGLGFNLQMFDKTGAKTLDPHEATRFFATTPSNDPEVKSYSILVSVHDENKDSHLDIKTPNLKNTKDFDFIRKLKSNLQRNIGDREGLSVNWYKFDHVIKPKDDLLNNITESKDISKPYGTTKSSFQRVGNSKLIIRHTDSVNEEKKGSRWRHVKAIFVENNIGERLHYPHMHIAGARAMARHFANGGSMHDEIGEAIQRLSSDFTDLKRSAKLLRVAGDNSKTMILGEVLKDINKKVKRLSGPRGYNSLLDSLKADKVEVLESGKLFDSLVQECGVEPGTDDANALQTASRYLNKDLPTMDVKFSMTPDVTSQATKFGDQKERLAWQIHQLAETVDDLGLKEKLVSVVDALKENGMMHPDDIELVRTVFKASKGVKNQEVVENLIRIKALSGIDSK